MKIVITKELEPSIITDDDVAQLTDEQIIDELRKDLLDLMDGATWEIER